MVMQGRLFFLENSNNSGVLDIVPSSFTISHNTPAGAQPAKRDRSTEASVCPGRTKTPPCRHLNGNMCPGLLKSSGTDDILDNALIVAVLSAAEIPVVVPTRRSTVTVNAVDMASSFCVGGIMRGISSLSKSSPVIPTQITPLVCLTINAIVSSVTLSPDTIKSPSFSLSSSSSTTTGIPCRRASKAVSMLSNPSDGTSNPFLAILAFTCRELYTSCDMADKH
mmetsp:Transcript_8253/g.16549  ORF Transcript_8253/g.16549 Transcript_8253/m.16549 type:complete len:223 (-) Transcript_8253:259-927(-)